MMLIQEGFSYLMHTREEKLFSNIQKRLQQAAINDRERRALLAQLESRLETQKVLVCYNTSMKGNDIDCLHREILL